MGTLLIELAGPMQAWGSRSRFSTRGTERAPTRSGVIGLFAAALGIDRTGSLERFDSLRFGVRIDQPGKVERDFQTARTLDGKETMPLSERYYLADAVFLAGVESANQGLLREIQDALRRPHFPLYLGRRAFAPAGPLPTALVPQPLRTALERHPWKATSQQRAGRTPKLEVFIDTGDGELPHLSLQDFPRSFDPRRRQYDWRDVTVLTVSPPDAANEESAEPRQPDHDRPDHDPLTLVSEEEI